MDKWTTTKSESLVDNHWVKIRKDSVVLPNEQKMQNIMASFRKSITEFAGKKVLKCLDYSRGIDGLPKSDVLKFFLEDNCSIVVRPSGTEPKLKAYISVSAATKEEAQVVEGELARAVEEKM